MSGFTALQVVEKLRETDRATCLRLAVPAQRAADFEYLPGQHVALRAQVDGTELRRTYSLCPRKVTGELRICVRHDDGAGMSRYLSESLEVSMQIDALPPSGGFHLNGPADGIHVVGFAAGIGITPMMAIATAVLESKGGSSFTLCYGNRDAAAVLFAEELQGIKNRHMQRLALHFFMSREHQEIDMYNGRIDAQKVARMTPALFDAARVDQFFICGPGSMAKDVSEALHRLGVDPKRVHSERFTLEGDDSVNPVRAGRRARIQSGTIPETSVTVRMDGRSKQFDMPRDGTLTLLDAAARAGLDLPFSCKAGVCSTCRTHLASGQVEMNQNFALEESELAAGFILACQSVPISSTIELDYDAR